MVKRVQMISEERLCLFISYSQKLLSSHILGMTEVTYRMLHLKRITFTKSYIMGGWKKKNIQNSQACQEKHWLKTNIWHITQCSNPTEPQARRVLYKRVCIAIREAFWMLQRGWREQSRGLSLCLFIFNLWLCFEPSAMAITSRINPVYPHLAFKPCWFINSQVYETP